MTLQLAAALDDRQHLLAEWRVAISQYDKARIERRLWESTSREERRTGLDYAKWVSALTGEKYGYVLWRGTLMNAGTDASPLWERIAAGEFNVRIGTQLLSDGRWLAKRDRTTDALGVIKALKLHDEAPTGPGRSGGGKLKLRREPLRGEGRSRRFKGAAAVAAATATVVPAAPTTRGPFRAGPRQRSNTPLAEANRFWASIREQVVGFVRERVTDVDEIVVERLISEMLGDLKVLTGSWSQKLSRATRVESGASVIKRAKVISACRTLSIDPPKTGKPINLTLANANKKALARAYHPDGSGSDATAHQYQEVLEAYATLEEYAEQYGQTKK